MFCISAYSCTLKVAGECEGDKDERDLVLASLHQCDQLTTKLNAALQLPLNHEAGTLMKWDYLISS